jgi:hypothetical protein
MRPFHVPRNDPVGLVTADPNATLQPALAPAFARRRSCDPAELVRTGLAVCWTAAWCDAELRLRSQPFRRIRCIWTRRLDAVEASSGGERGALGNLGEVLVDKHPGDELLARSDADLVVEALGVVFDRVRRDDQRLGDLGA